MPQTPHSIFKFLLLLVAVVVTDSSSLRAGDFGPDPFSTYRAEIRKEEEARNPALRRISAAKDEVEVVAAARALDDDAVTSDTATREHGLLNAAISLREKGTTKSLPYLDELTARQPQVLTPILICRQVITTPLYPFAQAAAESAFAIRSSDAHTRFSERAASDDFAWIEETSGLSERSPDLAGALAAIRDLSPGMAHAARLLAKNNSRAGQSVFVEASLAADEVPSNEEFLGLDDDIALIFFQRAEEFSSANRETFLAIAHGDPRTNSAAVLAGSSTATIRKQLEKDGASAAARISNDHDEHITDALQQIAADGNAGAELRRVAILALILQDTDAAQAALKEVAKDESLDAALREKVEGYLHR